MSRRSHARLANNLPVVVTPQAHLHSVCIAVAVRCGGRDDTRGKWGLSHFVEHMMFRGSRAHADAAALVAPFEQGGGTLNAETWRDHTLFWTVVHPKHAERAMAALGDMMAHPRFGDLELERALVEAELALDIDESGEDTDIGALSRASIWGDHPMGRRIVGSTESLGGLTRRDVRRLHGKAYVSENMAISIAGRVSTDKAHLWAAQHFGSIPTGPRLALGKAPVFRRNPVLMCCPQPSHQITLQLSFRALPDGHEDFTAQSLLVSLLDDGMGTRLHRALSEQSGLVYDFETGLDCYEDCGLFDIEMQVAPHLVHDALARTLAVLQNVAQGGVSDEELQRAKQRALIALELAQDSVEEVAQEAAVDSLFNRPSPKQHRARIKATNPGHITQLAQDIFCSADRKLTLLGPTKGVHTQALKDLMRHTLGPGAPKLATPAPARPCLSQAVSGARRTRAGRYTKATQQQ